MTEMTEKNTVPDASLQWIPDAFPEGFSVTLVRGIAWEELAARMTGDPASLSCTVAEAQHEETTNPGSGHLLQFGSDGDWSFCLQSWRDFGMRRGVIEAVSIGAEAVCVSSLADGSAALKYARDGIVVMAVDLAMIDAPDGADPEALAEAFSEFLEPGAARTWATPREALAFVTATFGAAVSPAVVLEAPMPTARVH